ncbi:MAG TPA: PPC domain-containing protein, partial [Gemmataceae bacterium]|nr:PPC domain-containing protein [Gemmataceae bacterium]
MQEKASRTSTIKVTLCLAIVGAVSIGSGVANAQPNLPGSQWPNPRLFTVTPPGGKIGTSVEVTFTGTDLEEPQNLLFSHPGIKAEPIIPPAPPAPKAPPAAPADPKQPAPKPMAPPPAPPITKFKVTIAPETPVGVYDVRLVNKWGVSNARAFVVGDLTEVLEKEPNNDVDQAQRIEVNTIVNGVISAPTDVDYYVFAGKKGQRVVISCLASSIDSRLHAGLELYDANSRRLAFNQKYHENDALVDATLSGDGDYYVRLVEYTHTQGSPEHFYRLSVSTAPWIDAVFPPVVEPGKTTQLTVYGRNLPGGQLDLTTVVDGRPLEKLAVALNAPGDPVALQRLEYGGRIGPASSSLDGMDYRLRNATGFSNPFLLTFARAPVVLGNDTNLTPEKALEVPLPCEIAGRIAKKGQRDWYSFSAKKDEAFSIETFSDRLGAPTDLYCIIRNPANKQQLADLEDNPETLSPFKFFTRSDDPPRFKFVAPADGKYQIMISSREADVQAGPRNLYRVRITPEQPDFRLIVMPADDNRPDSCRLCQNGHQFFTVLVWRLDGFTGPVTLTAEDLPAGVTCLPQVIGPNLKQGPLVIEAAPTAPPGAYEIKVKGTATINGQPVVREARAANITWPTQPGTNIPAISRLDRKIVMAVREPPPYRLNLTLDKPAILQGEKANLTVKVARLLPDFKGQLQAQALDLPPNQLTVNNNAPMILAAGKDEFQFPVEARANLLPGIYTIVLRSSSQVPFNKDPMAKQKPNINVVVPSAAIQ